MFLLFLTLVLGFSNPVNSREISIRQCIGVVDSRNESSRFIEVPGHRMTTGNSWNFSLSKPEVSLCDSKIQHVIVYEEKIHKAPLPPLPSKSITRAVNLRGRMGTQFSPDGRLEYQDVFYNPDEFCISRITEEEIELNICSINCSDKNTLCIPKCCGIGEVLVYWKWTCEKVPDDTAWSPFLYDSPHQRISKKERESLRIHYSRPLLNCTVWDKSGFRWPFSTVKRPIANKTADAGYLNRIRVLKNGQVVYLEHTRRWKDIPKGEYCLDGFINWGKGGNETYTGDEKHQVLLLCPEESAAEPHAVQDEWVSDLYAWVLFISSFFLFLTAAVHFALFDRQNIHGLTILSQSISLFFMYIFHGTAYFVSFRRHSENDYRSPGCFILAVLGHFFFLTTFSWLSVVNFDLWLTFRSMRPVSKMSKKMRRFRLYSLIGWGIPLIMIGIFLFLDFHFRDIESEVIVPDYAVVNCFVASWARWHYNCSILALVIPINLAMMASTFKIFYDFKKGNGPLTTKRAKSDRYSFRLFVKLFIVMGVIWSFELIFCWMYNGIQAPWYLIALDFVMFFQAVAVFMIFCWNRRTLKQLEEKYPSLKRTFAPMKRLLNITETDLDTNETTPATPCGTMSRKMSTASNVSHDGNTSRKMSITSNVSQEGTIDRRYIN